MTEEFAKVRREILSSGSEVFRLERELEKAKQKLKNAWNWLEDLRSRSTPEERAAMIEWLDERTAGMPELCKSCGYPPKSMPAMERKNGDHIWICPLCGNEGDVTITPFRRPIAKAIIITGLGERIEACEESRKPMTDHLETK